MNEFQFECPKCGQNILATAQWTGRRMTCSSCETRLVIPSPTSPPKKGGVLPLGMKAPAAARIRVKLPPKAAKGASASAPRSAQRKEVGRRRQ